MKYVRPLSKPLPAKANDLCDIFLQVKFEVLGFCTVDCTRIQEAIRDKLVYCGSD